MPTIKPEMQQWRIRLMDGQSHPISAAYFSDDHGMIVFKDDQHRAVYASRPDFIAAIERVDEQDQAPDSGLARVELSKDFGDLDDLLRVADDKGHAHGRLFQSETRDDGRTYQYGYVIQVSALASLDIAREA